MILWWLFIAADCWRTTTYTTHRTEHLCVVHVYSFSVLLTLFRIFISQILNQLLCLTSISANEQTRKRNEMALNMRTVWVCQPEYIYSAYLYVSIKLYTSKCVCVSVNYIYIHSCIHTLGIYSIYTRFSYAAYNCLSLCSMNDDGLIRMTNSMRSIANIFSLWLVSVCSTPGHMFIRLIAI